MLKMPKEAKNVTKAMALAKLIFCRDALAVCTLGDGARRRQELGWGRLHHDAKDLMMGKLSMNYENVNILCILFSRVCTWL
jgi:hypothetical protein